MRLIDANALMKRICGYECGMHPEDCDGMESETVPCNFHAYVSEAPTVDAQPVKRGKWMKRMSAPDSVKCCLCGYVSIQESSYCGGCGAFMRGDSGD